MKDRNTTACHEAASFECLIDIMWLENLPSVIHKQPRPQRRHAGLERDCDLGLSKGFMTRTIAPKELKKF
ncbi:hypothetical protein J1614_010188 [Plenodomus biglobosus]|nr:hypothetical protein J1614_010188 [Plenodomus biglobosus]